MQRLRIVPLLLILSLAACTQREQASSTDSTSPHALATPAPTHAPTALPATSPGESAGNQPAPAPEPRYRPDQSAVPTKTFEIPSGTSISVRNNEPIDSSQAVVGQIH